jgi:hypothetical protein
MTTSLFKENLEDKKVTVSRLSDAYQWGQKLI